MGCTSFAASTPELHSGIWLCRQLAAMCAAHVEAVKAYLAPLCGGGTTGADPDMVNNTAANLAFSLAVVAQCGPAAISTGVDLHSLFGRLLGLLPSVRTCWVWCLVRRLRYGMWLAVHSCTQRMACCPLASNCLHRTVSHFRGVCQSTRDLLSMVACAGILTQMCKRFTCLSLPSSFAGHFSIWTSV